MFFLLSKILSFLFSPLSWVFILLIIVFFLKTKKWKKRLIYTSVVVLYLFSNNYIFYLAASKWYIKPVKLETHQQFKYAIVLGGMANFDEEVKRIKFSESADRLMQAIHLYKTNHIEKILISGGSGSIFYPEMIESEIVRTYLIQIGIPECDILIENKSKNTWQNASFTAKLLDNNKNYLLISSSIHMRRATACFKKAGIKTQPYPSNQLDSSFKYSPGSLLLPNASILSSWELLIHEIAGYFIYWIKGYV